MGRGVKSEGAAASAPHGDGLVLAGLMLGVLLAALDQTVVGTSLPKIVSDIGGGEHFAWLFSAYMLTSTIVIPLASKLSDLYGRRPVLLVGMAVFLVGSVLCGIAGSMTELILYRGLQGLGGGVIFPVVLATIADLYPPGDRGKVQGLFGATFGLSSVLGPFLGGWIVDNLHLFGVTSWRWVFLVNLPVGLAAIGIVALHFPRIARQGKAAFDVAGVVALSTALTAGLLVTVWGGETFPWASWQIVALSALAVASAVAFVAAERRAEDPVVPLAMFKSSIFTTSVIATLLMGSGMFAVLSFLPMFMQGVIGITATYSGLVITPLMVTLVIGAQVSGRLVAKVGYKPFALAGTAITAAGFVWLATFDASTRVAVAVAAMLVIGLGLGFTMQTYILAVQNAVERRFVATATGAITLARTLGATLGVTVLGVVLNARLAQTLPERVPAPALEGLLASPFIDGRLARIPSLLTRSEFLASGPPAAVVDGIKAAFSASVSVVFLAGAAVCAAALVATAFLKAVPMKSRAEYMGAREPDAEEAPAPTMH